MSSYTVQRDQGVTLVFGSVPLADLAALTGADDDAAVMDLGLASLVGALIAFGSPEALAAFKARGVTPGPQRQIASEAARSKGLSTEAQEWALRGDHGASSLALFAALTGVRIGDVPSGTPAPRDADDFRRCSELCRSVPECSDLRGAVKLSPQWAALIAAWDDLTALLTAPDRSGWAALSDRIRALTDRRQPAAPAGGPT